MINWELLVPLITNYSWKMSRYDAKIIIHENQPVADFIQNLLENPENKRSGIVKVSEIILKKTVVKTKNHHSGW